jgi:thiol-disulfide isomerase/thioredoxin
VLEVPPLPTAPPIRSAREAFYRSAVPTAQRFEAIPVPKEMLLSEDKGSNSYVRALDGTGELIGYLRDFSGPVIPGRRRNPHPIAVLLVFDTDLELRGLVPASPMLKAEGQALSAAELEQLSALAAAPPAVLSEFPRTSDVVDATTEATRAPLRGAVVAGAAYTSHRIVGLVARTQELIQRTPGAWDDKRIGELIGTAASDASVAKGLAALLPTLATFERRLHVYRTMARTYARALRVGSHADAAVEAMLVHPPLDPGAANTEIADGCYALARHRLRHAVVSTCVARVTSASLHPGNEDSVARLVGTDRLRRGNAAGALAPLRRAASVYDRTRDPELHLRLVQAAIAAGEGAPECSTAQELFREHPLLPGVDEALAACGGDTAALAALLRRSQRRSLLAGQRIGDTPVPALSLENEGLRTVEVAPAISNTVSVWVFFSTWCSHCATELPRVNAFVRAVEARADLRARIRVIGIRTAVEKERIPYAQFLAQVRPEFPIYFDSTMSLVFGQFCRTQSIAPELPTLAVLDSQGVVRFLLASGPYRDTSQELIWAVETLLQP